MGFTYKKKQKSGTRKYDIKSYYKNRKAFKYYQKVQSMLFKLPFTSILDVGSRKSPVMEHIDSSIYKAMLDIKPMPVQPGIHTITADFYKWKPDREYDIALCLQVLEHLDRPKEFVEKLFQVARFVIISVPYKWAKGDCKYHVQDPIDEHKIFSWTGREPDEKHIVTDVGKRRIICLYK
jgi:hypothetical protein